MFPPLFHSHHPPFCALPFTAFPSFLHSLSLPALPQLVAVTADPQREAATRGSISTPDPPRFPLVQPSIHPSSPALGDPPTQP
ncbi:hypothetical protein E2C01_089292 [Portunus trituberculatus]|uniref:Uncharacterized protein n=1 Tax=Portunus trituberculatus TaxID=210409 RepID=A0A5B7JGU3_PORTR|nr:hypothetical protein [Portunus trituberculatus]